MTAILESDPTLDLVSLYVERIDRQPSGVQERVLCWADEGTRWQRRTIPVRLIAQSDEGVRPSDLLPSLRHRLSPLVIALPSLTTRRSEIPQIALALADEISEHLGLPEPVIDDAALARLAEREWPGDLEELEAVITRALIAAGGERIDGFEAGAPAPRRRSRARAGEAATLREPVAARSLGGEPAAPDPRALEIVLTELAHELKNPMVTIKTFADHIDELGADPALREKFVGLVLEAIGRMDGFLEELLVFSRFSGPRRQTVALRQVLTQAVSQNDARIREQLRLNGLSKGARVHVDEEQMVFALKTLIRGLARELPTEASIVVDLAANGDLVFSAAGPTSGRLGAVLDHDRDG
ncbi:MAG: histidine kinase dimerization/phospho-acceptor domain-containing protein, partial [Candidatus Binatia bacterium]